MRLGPAGVVVLAILAFGGCGSGNGGGGIVDRSGGSSAVLVNMADAPADRFDHFDITFDSVTLTSTSGSTVELVTAPTRVEFIHRAGRPSPVWIGDVPSGTYSSLKLSLKAIAASYISDNGTGTAGPVINISNSRITVPLSPQLQTGSSALVLNIDVDLGASLQSFTPSTNTGTFNPVIKASVSTVGSQGSQSESNGLITEFLGSVSSVTSDGFTLHSEQTMADLRFTAGSSTELSGISSLSQLAKGKLLLVNGEMGSTKAAATKIRVLAPNGGYAGAGLMTYNLGGIVGQEVESSGMAPCMVCAYFMNADNNTRFEIENSISTSGLSFAVFSSAADYRMGQRLMFAADSATSSNIFPSLIQLRDQSFTGTVSGAATNSGTDVLFLLQLPADSYLRLLMGTSTLSVVQRSGTQMRTTLAPGAALRVQGLLFFDTATGEYKLVASRIEAAN